jgi:sugar lactone lactonase YvrE
MKRVGTFSGVGLVSATLSLVLLNTSILLSLSEPIIMTYAGLSATDGSFASTQFIETPHSVTSDGGGGFYFAAGRSRVYRVSSAGVLVLVAGRGTPGFSGDGGLATASQLSLPLGITVGSNGDLFIADMFNSRVRKVTTDGVISTVAGTVFGFAGDGGPATSAALKYPKSMAVDANGNLFIADSYDYRIRKVTAGGIITTVAGTGTSGFSGDGGPATSAKINPQGVAVDADGNLFIADGNNNRIRKVGVNGIITTVAGDGTSGFGGDDGPAILAQLSNPSGIAVDQNGNLFIADSANDRIRKVSSNGIITIVAGNGIPGFGGDGGSAVSAQLAEPVDVAVDGSGSLFIADSANYRVRMVTQAGMISTVAGTGAPSSAQFDYPGGVAFDGNDNLFVASLGQKGILKFPPSGIPAILANTTAPTSIAIDSAGDLFITDASPYFVDWSEEGVRKITPQGIVSTVGGDFWYFFDYDGLAPNGEFCVAGIAVDPNGNLIVAETIRQSIWRITPDGKALVAGTGNGTSGFSGDGGPATSAMLSFPNGVAADKNGNLFIADSYNNRIRKVSSNGIITTVAGNGWAGFGGDGGPATSAELWYPLGVAVDQDGNLFIADSHNNRIRKVSTDGIITTVAGNGTFGFSGDGGPPTSAQLDYPSAIALDSSGNLFIADSGNNRVRKVTANSSLPIKKRRSQLTSQ